MVFFFLYFCSMNYIVFPLPFLILPIYFLSFLFDELGQRFVNFLYPFKEQILGFIDFLNFEIFISSLIFIISFLMLTLGFVCSFSKYFRWWVQLFEIVLKEGLYCYELPCKNAFAISHRFCMAIFSWFASRQF